METNNNRLLLELDRIIRDMNRETINPHLPELTLASLEPVIRQTATARALYLKELFDLSQVCGNGIPTEEQIKKLRQMRLYYEELVHGAQAIETAVQRGYLDVQGR